MGTSLSCVQVYIGDKQKNDTRDLVIETLRQRVLEGSFTEKARGEAKDSDRTVFVGPLGDAPWLTIFDSQGDLRELAQRVSAAINGTAVFINLLDSDIVHLRRYSDGELVDDYCNAPHLYDGYGPDPDWLPDWGDMTEEELKAATRGDLASWRDLLISGTDLSVLREIWDSEPVFADDILWASTDALAMNKDDIFTDFWFDAEKYTQLNFRLKEPRLYEVKAEGPPKLVLLHGSVESNEVYVGQQLDLPILVQNDGGADTGIDIIVWGTALGNKMIELLKVQVWKMTDSEALKEMTFTTQKEIDKGQEEMPLYVASLDDFEVPQGISSGAEVMSQRGVDFHKVYEAIAQTQFQVRVLCNIESVCSGELFIAIAPQNNKEAEQVVYRAYIKALPMPRKPLRYHDAQKPIHPINLRKLETPSHLFALISLGTGQEQSAEVVANEIEMWVTEIASNDTDSFSTYLRMDLDLHHKSDNISTLDIPGSPYWKELREALGNCMNFLIKSRTASAIYDANTLFMQNSNTELAPQLMFRYSTVGMDKVEFEAINKWLQGMVNRIMTKASVLQAIVGRWEWHDTMDVNMTPYEIACGIGGQCTTARFWCMRFLRGVTEQLWLGPNLLTQLGGTKRLSSIATVTPCGDGVHITLNEESTLNELEKALECVLASEIDWREGMERLYPRKQ